MSIEKQIETINSSLKDVGDKLKAYAEQSEREIKNHSKLSEETRANVDKLLTQQGELQARLMAAEQMVAKLESGHGGLPARAKSMGRQVADSDGYKAFAANASRGSQFRMSVQAAITSDAGSFGEAIRPDRVPGIVAPAMQRLFLRDLLSWGRTGSNSVEFFRETGFTNNAGVVGENPSGGKPQSNIIGEADAANVATLAHWIDATKQVLFDLPMLQSHIDGRLMYGLKLKEEAQLLKGSGVGLNINGVFTQASAYLNPGVVVAAETRIDRLRLALLQAELAEYMADGIVLNPIDWCAIELTKDQNNGYLFSNPRFMAAAGLWGRPVVATQSMDMGDFLVGSFQQGAQGWDREDASIIVSLENKDNVTQNMVTILCEERVALTVYRPEAFVKGDFDGIDASA